MIHSYESQLTTLVNLINNFALNQNREYNITQIINDLIIKKEPNYLIYDGLTFCQLKGKIIGTEKKIELQINNKLKVSVLQESLKELIENYCFVNGRFEIQYSIINGVQFILQNGNKSELSEPINLEITDEILIKVYGNVVFQKQMEEIQNFYEESQKYQENFAKSLPIKCHKTNKEILMLSDGLNIQSFIYSIEGALEMLSKERDILFDHQINFLESYKKIMKS